VNVVTYLAYGSNLHPQRLRKRVPSAALSGVVELRGWKLCFHKRSNKDGSGKCSIVRTNDSADVVYAAIFTLMEAERHLLEGVEGVGYGYNEIHLEIPRHGDVFTYIASPGYIADELRPYTWYKELVVVGASFHKFPASYIEEIGRVEAVEDLNEERNERKWSLVRSLNV